MAYEVYKQTLSIEEYFKRWDTEKLIHLDEKIREDIYNKYCVKAEVFRRDNFKCQNVDCITPTSALTLHHIRWQKNDGKDSVRNCVIVCKSCHSAFHKSKRSITLSDNESLPAHVRGHTYKVDKPEEINWKNVKASMAALRKELKHKGYKAHITWEMIYYLMKWLESGYEEGDDD